jgi:DNA ligase (NAD+)
MNSRPADSVPEKYLENCPECGFVLIRNEGESIHYCPNELNCPPQIKGRIEHFISRKAMNIESLGEGKVEILFDNGLITSIADLYDLKYEQLFGLEKLFTDTETGKTRIMSFKEKTVKNILKGIEKSKQVPFERVLYAIGIRYVGQTVAKKLAFHFKDIDTLGKAGFDELIEVEEIGEKIARSIIGFFSNAVYITLIDRLKQSGLKFRIDDVFLSFKSYKLEGRSFIVSGVFSRFSREEIKKMIEENGGINVSAISSKTDFVLAGEKMGSAKREKARTIGIPIITEEDFLKMIE